MKKMQVVAGVVLTVVGIAVGLIPVFISNSGSAQIAGLILVAVSILALLAMITKLIKDAKAIRPINPDNEFRMSFYRYEHDSKCSSPEYIHGSKDQPKACIDAIMQNENPSAAICDCCGGKFIDVQSKLISIRGAENIVREFLAVLNNNGWFDDDEANGQKPSGTETLLICLMSIAKEIDNFYHREKVQKWVYWVLDNINNVDI